MIMNAHTRDRDFRGRQYRHVAAAHIPASYETFDDERDVRLELWTVEEGDVVFDIGAAYGSYALAALAMGAHRVYAWAPQGHPVGPATEMEADFLEQSAALNGWSDRLRVYRDGLYDRTGWLNAWSQEFFTTEPPKRDGRFVDNEILAVRTIDAWAAKEIAPNSLQGVRTWMKLDVEGAEVAILRSAGNFIRRFSPRIFVENHNFKHAATEQEVRAIVTSWGYREIATRPYRNYSHSLYAP
jgi:FkbM family methyltransferase